MHPCISKILLCHKMNLDPVHISGRALFSKLPLDINMLDSRYVSVVTWYDTVSMLASSDNFSGLSFHLLAPSDATGSFQTLVLQVCLRDGDSVSSLLYLFPHIWYWEAKFNSGKCCQLWVKQEYCSLNCGVGGGERIITWGEGANWKPAGWQTYCAAVGSVGASRPLWWLVTH